jgi:hypothetical protein
MGYRRRVASVIDAGGRVVVVWESQINLDFPRESASTRSLAMSSVLNLRASSASAVHLRRIALAGSVAVIALLGACAVPMMTATSDYSAAAAPTRYGTVRHIDVVEAALPVAGQGAAENAVTGRDVGP